MLYILLGLMVLCYALQSLFEKLYAANCKGDSGEASLRFAVIFGVFIGVATLAAGCISAGGFSFAPSRATIIYAIGAAAMLVIFHLTQIGATMRGSYAIANLCMLFGGILIPMVVSMIQMGQRLSVLQIIAVVMMCAAFVLLNCQGMSLKGAKKGFWFCCIALGISNGVFGSFLALQADFTPGERTEMLTVGYLTSAVLALLVLLFRKVRGKGQGEFHMTRWAVLFALGCCAVATVAVNILSYLLARMNVTVVNTVDNGGVLILAALFGLIIFREKLTKLQFCGLGVALASVILLSF